jgi:DNA-directed RNA polymerase specialized sigma24 family protein
MEPLPEVTSSLLDRIEQEVTEDLLKRVILHAHRKISGRYWRGVWNGSVPGGKEAEDLAYEALGDVLSGKRRWDPEEDPSFLRYLCGVVDSKVSKLVNRPENRNELRAPINQEGGEHLEYFDALPDAAAIVPDDQLISEETEQANNQLLVALLEFVGDDPMLVSLLECFIDGVEGRANIASKLGTSPHEVTLAQKRLDRRLAAFRKDFSQSNPFRT